MTLSKRERYIIAASIAAVLLVALDRYVVTPLFERRARTVAAKAEAVGRMENALNLFAQSRRMTRKWQEMLASGFRGDTTHVESALLRALRDWSRESGLTLSSLKPERLAEEGAFSAVSVHAVGSGTMESVAKFLWRVETAKLPLKIEEFQVGARREATDDLSLQMRLSALHIPEEPKRAAPGPNGEAAVGEDP